MRAFLVLLPIAVCAACSATSPPTPAAAVRTESSPAVEWVDTAVGKAVRASGAVKAPAVVKHVNPTYPESDREAHRQGLIRIEVVIDEAGQVAHADVLEAPSATLARTVLAAVRQWTFEPTLLEGRPVRVVMPVTVQMKL